MGTAFTLLQVSAGQWYVPVGRRASAKGNTGHISTTSYERTAAGRPPDAMEPGFHSVRTRWIPGFMAFQLARRTQTVLLAVPV